MEDIAFEVDGADRTGRWIVTCDHASNAVPDFVNGGELGLPAEDMGRHIAYDVGADGLSRKLAELLNGPVILSKFSRLVIDPNRGEDDPTLLMKLYDGTIIPANRHADNQEREKRLERLHRPYHEAYEKLVVARSNPIICAVHSFTPQLRGRPPRPWEVGVLYASDDRFALPFIEACKSAGWCVGDNQPYSGHLPGDSIDRHALRAGHPNVLIELRNDLIEDDAGQTLWAERLAPILKDVLADTGL